MAGLPLVAFAKRWRRSPEPIQTDSKAQGIPVQIKISTRHGHLSDASQQKIEAKVEKLSRIFDRLTSIDVTVDLEHEERPSVSLEVSAEHKHDFVSTVSAENLWAALEGASHKVEQQLRKYKEKIQERHRSPDGRRQEVPVETEAETAED
jgi:putative sigma-54 modulation protein